MKKYFIIAGVFILSIVIVAGCKCKSSGIFTDESRTFYIDSSLGNDINKGTSKSSPWKSLSRINDHIFQPGDKILFKAGCKWDGNLIFKDSGEKGGIISVDMYGTGRKPVFTGGETSDIVLLSNIEYWEINNLDISGTSANKNFSAIKIFADNGKKNHLYIRNCEIHDFTGRSAIRITGNNRNRFSLFDDLRIENNFIHDCPSLPGRCTHGIEMWTYDDEDFGPSKNVHIVNNKIVNISGDGIVLQHCNGGIVEYNYVNNCASSEGTGSHAAIWCAFTNDAVFQYNEVCYTKKPLSNNDGMAFDVDIGSKGTIIQYNYSHDNDGGFHLSMNRDSTEIIRYNISQNDKFRVFFQGFPSEKCLIYNNIFYGPSQLSHLQGRAIEVHEDGIGGTWWNNIFWSTDVPYEIPATGSNNISWGNATGGIHMEPGLVNPGSGGTGINMKDVNRLSGYMLKTGSPLINIGRNIPDNGFKDFWGKALYKDSPDIGVDEYGAKL